MLTVHQTSKAIYVIKNLLVDSQNLCRWLKITIILPLLVIDKFFTNFLEKANLFNEYFSKQCQPSQNNSTIPKSNMYYTENRLHDIIFDNEKLLKIIQFLDANKAHGYDCISRRMLNLCSPSITKPLSIILVFPQMITKKKTLYRSIENNKQLVNNSMLPVC